MTASACAPDPVAAGPASRFFSGPVAAQAARLPFRQRIAMPRRHVRPRWYRRRNAAMIWPLWAARRARTEMLKETAG
ncbi:hypothetical protein IT41_17610 [Paracoccus halophilus]|uniref:Uncharacterized protein n=1 Tax=Paracoccus halophilus TaxID=376733 RepID=A0A099EWP2_9RHOB|nr:hypothetical protein IT41_17610 [Paracoccus halophilus]